MKNVDIPNDLVLPEVKEESDFMKKISEFKDNPILESNSDEIDRKQESNNLDQNSEIELTLDDIEM